MRIGELIRLTVRLSEMSQILIWAQKGSFANFIENCNNSRAWEFDGQGVWCSQGCLSMVYSGKPTSVYLLLRCLVTRLQYSTDAASTWTLRKDHLRCSSDFRAIMLDGPLADAFKNSYNINLLEVEINIFEHRATNPTQCLLIAN